MRVRIWCPRPSASARALGFLRLRPQRSRFRGRPTDCIINWGSHTGISDEVAGLARILNHPVLLPSRIAALDVLRANGHPVVDYTTSQAIARAWADEGFTVIARTLQRASGGRGIVVCRSPDEVVNAPLYTGYFKKRFEYRVHVIGEETLVQYKVRRSGVPSDPTVRSYDNGWSFTPNPHCDDATRPVARITADAVDALTALDLEFGAFDVAYNFRRDEYRFLEVNTAPGLSGETTLNFYRNNLVGGNT